MTMNGINDSYRPPPAPWATVEDIDFDTADVQMVAPPPIDVTTIGPDYEPDPEWVHVDAAGHEHRLVDDEYPTLRRITEPDYTVDQGDGYVEEYPGDSWYECVQCAERIEPGYRVVRGSDQQRSFISGGAPTVIVNGTVVPPDQIERFLERRREHAVQARRRRIETGTMRQGEELTLLRALVRKTFTPDDGALWVELTEHLVSLDGGVDITPDEHAYIARIPS